eukprot:5514072-Alexandrium_andersonii.AAC.2
MSLWAYGLTLMKTCWIEVQTTSQARNNLNRMAAYACWRRAARRLRASTCCAQVDAVPGHPPA